MADKQNILFIVHALKSGGVETVLNRLSRHMAEQGHGVTIVSLSKDRQDDGRASAIRDHGIKLVQCPVADTNPLRWIVVPFFLCCFFVRHREFERIIIPGVVNAIIAIPVIRVLSIKAKIIVNAHTAFSAYYQTAGRCKRLFLALGKWILPWADIVGNDSQGAAEDLAEHYALDRVDVFHNPVATIDDLNYDEIKAHAPHDWLQDNAFCVFVSCGRLVAMKNYAHMIRVFAQLVGSDPALRLIIIGNGPEKHNLETLVDRFGISDFVSFEGFVDDPKRYFYHADYFWLSSKFEGFSVVLGEALAMGIPCITNDCPFGPAEVIDRGKYGLLLDNYEVDDNVRAINDFLARDVQPKHFYRARAEDFLVSKIATLYLQAA